MLNHFGQVGECVAIDLKVKSVCSHLRVRVNQLSHYCRFASVSVYYFCFLIKFRTVSSVSIYEYHN